MKTFETVTTQKVTSMVCDGCGLEASKEVKVDFKTQFVDNLIYDLIKQNI